MYDALFNVHLGGVLIIKMLEFGEFGHFRDTLAVGTYPKVTTHMSNLGPKFSISFRPLGLYSFGLKVRGKVLVHISALFFNVFVIIKVCRSSSSPQMPPRSTTVLARLLMAKCILMHRKRFLLSSLFTLRPRYNRI